MLLRFLFTCIIVINSVVQAVGADDIINFKEFEAYVEKSMDEWQAPGAAIAIVKDDKIVYLKTFGVKEIGKKDPIAEDTIFPIVSLTKAFTVAVVARLVEEGKLNWDDPVINYLPDFKLADEQVTKELTIRDLLSHRSGLPGFAVDSLVETGWSSQEVYHALPQIPLVNGFRQQYNYQNVFPGLAGMIIEKVTGKTLAQAYQDYLFVPLALTHTSIGKDGVTASDSWWRRLKAKVQSYFVNKVKLHQPDNGKIVVMPEGNPAIYCFEASRGMNSSIKDMASWLIFQIADGKYGNQQLLSPASINEMRTPHINVGAPQGGRQFPPVRVPDINYGAGWFLHKYDRLTMLSHMGGMIGIRSFIAFAPEEKVGIVILSNLGGMRVSFLPEAIRSKFFDMYLKLVDQHDWSQELRQDFDSSRQKTLQQRKAARLKSPQPSQQLDVYTGAYKNDLYGTLTVTLKEGHLWVSYRNLKVKLDHWNGDSFSFKADEFSKAYSGIDIGDVSFGFSKEGKQAYGLAINLLYEGKDSLFLRS